MRDALARTQEEKHMLLSRLLTPKETAERMRCHVITIRRRIKNGELDSVQFGPGGRRFCYADQIEAIIEKGRTTNGDES